MDLRKKPNGRWELRWLEAGRKRGRTSDRKRDAEQFMTHLQRRRQLGQATIPDDIALRQLVETYWRLHAVPNLAKSTRDFYKLAWVNHIMPRLGDYPVRELTPKSLARFRGELEHTGIGQATTVKCMRIVQSMLSFAIAEELVEFNAMAAVRKPRYERAREPHIFLPAEVEQIRANLQHLRDRTLVSVLAYPGPRPEEVVCRLTWDDIGERAIRYRDTKRHRVRFTPLLAPLAEDLRQWFLASGRPDNKTPVFPAHDGDFWDRQDWANSRQRIWQGRPAEPANARNPGRAARPGAAPAGTRPRDLRSSYITLCVYEGVPLRRSQKSQKNSARAC
jgi:integrase